MSMSSCMKVLCVTATIMNTTKKMLLALFCLCFFFSIQTVVGSGYYGIESSFLYMCNLKTRHCLELLSAACWLSRASGSQNSF